MNDFVHMRMVYCSSPMSASQMPSEITISIRLGNFVQKITLDAKPSSALVRLTYRNMLISLLVFHCFYSNRLLVRSISHLAVLRLVVAFLTIIMFPLSYQNVTSLIVNKLSTKMVVPPLYQCNCQSKLHPTSSLGAMTLSTLLVMNYARFMVQKLHSAT